VRPRRLSPQPRRARGRVSFCRRATSSGSRLADSSTVVAWGWAHFGPSRNSRPRRTAHLSRIVQQRGCAPRSGPRRSMCWAIPPHPRSCSIPVHRGSHRGVCTRTGAPHPGHTFRPSSNGTLPGRFRSTKARHLCTSPCRTLPGASRRSTPKSPRCPRRAGRLPRSHDTDALRCTTRGSGRGCAAGLRPRTRSRQASPLASSSTPFRRRSRRSRRTPDVGSRAHQGRCPCRCPPDTFGSPRHRKRPGSRLRTPPGSTPA